VIVHEDGAALRDTVATACRVLAVRGLVGGILGHLSARVSESEIIVRCRGRDERGLRATLASDIWRVTLDGTSVDLPAGYELPKELPIHTELLRARPELGAVIHAHPPAALLAGLAGLRPRAVFGAFNIPAMRLALDGVPVFPRAVLITRPELGREMVAAMGERPICLLRGHGITVAAGTVEQAVVTALNLNELLSVTVELARLHVAPPELSAEDLAELPDLGSAFNDGLTWQALLDELDRDGCRSCG
jgi:ribulose-5-phosphate 4-epimerase/fuculose-1-phosphate aldolase